MDPSQLKQTVEAEVLEDWKNRAQHEFPDLEQQQAFNTYVRQTKLNDAFFMDDDGERCVWRTSKF